MGFHRYPKNGTIGSRKCSKCGLYEYMEFQTPDCEGGTDHQQSFHFSEASKTITKCYQGHPEIRIGGFAYYGGSCITPSIDDADIYVGLDSGMECTTKELPWEPGYAFRYLIRDQEVPKNPKHFLVLIEWLRMHAEAGDKIHIGCIGGHGRTGLVLAGIAASCGEKDAINFVREHYCKKAVESKKQVDFLVKQFQCNPAKPSRDLYSYSKKSTPNSPGDGFNFIRAIPRNAVW